MAKRKPETLGDLRRELKDLPDDTPLEYTKSKIRNRWDDFGAGISLVYIIILVTIVVTSYGESSTDKVTVLDIIFMLFTMLIFSGAVIDLYKFTKGRK